jgi:Tfp pilus assembly protein PilV
MKFGTTLNQNGDTIVEVLLSVAIISSMLVGSFAIANKSSTQIRSAQERTEAAKLTSTVIEQIKSSPSDFITPADSWRCYKFDGYSTLPPGVGATDINDASFPVFNSANDKNNNYNSDCAFAPNSGVDYITFVRYDGPEDKFDINTRWDKAGGGREQVVMVYRSE